MKQEIAKLNEEIQQEKIQKVVAAMEEEKLAMEKEMSVTFLKRELDNERAKSAKLEKELEETRFKLQTINLGTRNDNNNNNNNNKRCCIM